MKKSRYLLLSLLAASLMSGSVSADEYIANDVLGKQSVADTFEYVRKIDAPVNGKPLNNPLDLFFDAEDNLYVLDSGNARIVVYGPDDRLLRVAEGNFGAGDKPMNKPEGLFVDDRGDIFVADTQNGRILHLDPTGRFVEEFREPESDLYDRTYPFKPVKIAVDRFGRMMILNHTDYHGIILMDGNNRFLGYIASTKIKFTLLDRFVRKFASEEQQAQIAKEVPAYFSNFVLADEFLYCTSYWTDREQIRKLTPAGGNVYPAKFYGEYNDSDEFNYKPAFADLAVDSAGMIYAADFVTGRIYVYDSEGQNLAIFGGKGNKTGRFDSISSVAVNSRGELYVLDRVTGVIQVFRPTALMRDIMEATALYNRGDYLESAEVWKKVRERDSVNWLADVGLAKAARKTGNFREAMNISRKSLDAAGYSEAFYEFRKQLLRDRFGLAVLVLAAGAAVVVWGFRRLKYAADDTEDASPVFAGKGFGLRENWQTGLLLLFHPTECFYRIKKNREKLNLFVPAVLFAAILGARVLYIRLVHFPLSNVTEVYKSFWEQTGFLSIPLLTFLTVGFALISLSDGKQTFLEFLTAGLYSFLPYVLFSVPLALLSRFLSGEEAGLFGALQGALWIWCFALLLFSLKRMNEYSGPQLFATVLKTLFAMVCFWMIAIVLFTVVAQSFDLVKSVYEEFLMRKYK